VQQPRIEKLPQACNATHQSGRLNRKRVAIGLAALTLVIVGVLLVNQWMRTNVARSVPSGAPEIRVLDESLLQWESSEQEVEQLLNDARAFDERAEKFWDDSR
jgi:hypothetical protein